MRYFIYLFYMVFFFLTKNSYTQHTIESKADQKILSEILHHLTETSKLQDTTSLRLEQKSVMNDHILKQIITPYTNGKKTFGKKNVSFVSRDKIAENTKNYTFTFYGKKLYYIQNGIKTSIKLRARFYLQKNLVSNSFTRSPGFEKKFFLELKIKNLNGKEINISRKYRVSLKDKYFLKLLTSQNSDKIEIIEKLQKSKITSSKKEEVSLFFHTLKKLISLDPSFAEIKAAISYSRTSYKLLDARYPIRKFCFFTIKRRPIEYQMTLDEDIKVFHPKLASIKNKDLNDYLLKYNFEDLIFEYPQNINFIEFKTPYIVSQKKQSKMSKIHYYLSNNIINKLFNKKTTNTNYKTNKGKLSQAKNKF